MFTRLKREILSDGSEVYCVYIVQGENTIKLDAIGIVDAIRLEDVLISAINSYTNEQISHDN